MQLKHKIKILYLHNIKGWDYQKIFIEHLKEVGMKIGKSTYIMSDIIETNEPYLVEIGDNCIISDGVRLLTHDASAKYYIDGASDIFGRVKIGNQCFIGAGAIVLCGAAIPDNCIVGAGSVVTKKFCNPGMVIAGNPAKELGTVEDLKKKNQQYKLNTWNMSFYEKKNYLLNNEDKFKGYDREND